MTLEGLLALGRIPTPAEFVAFAESQRWRFRVGEGGAALLANKDDPLALKFAKMLSREPYRTNVLALLATRPATQVIEPAVAPKPPEPATETCRVCGREVCEDDKPHLVDPAHCERGGSKAVTDGNGAYHPATERCPWKPR